jgi:mRNA degradation ribonuclease J1/J2
VYSEQADAVLKGAEDALRTALKRSKRTKPALENNAKDALSRYFYKATRRRPMVVPIVVEIES